MLLFELSIKIILLAGLKLKLLDDLDNSDGGLSIKIILLAGLKLGYHIHHRRATKMLSIKIILLAGLKLGDSTTVNNLGCSYAFN